MKIYPEVIFEKDNDGKKNDTFYTIQSLDQRTNREVTDGIICISDTFDGKLRS